jgi:hypothetical protein
VAVRIGVVNFPLEGTFLQLLPLQLVLSVLYHTDKVWLVLGSVPGDIVNVTVPPVDLNRVALIFVILGAPGN